MNQKKAKQIRKYSERQTNKIKRNFAVSLLTLPFRERVKIALKIIMGAKNVKNK